MLSPDLCILITKPAIYFHRPSRPVKQIDLREKECSQIKKRTFVHPNAIYVAGDTRYLMKFLLLWESKALIIHSVDRVSVENKDKMIPGALGHSQLFSDILIADGGQVTWCVRI
ncbi:hypothetical protein PUN28_019371 [Cardiocondyla obscurior]|uniref:Uncharacterized protein n=1 Tax=Cardiocondyla obscurior TaxID=286306 RepID=A0AAW2EC03_9HYME